MKPTKISLGVKPDAVAPSLNEVRAKLGLPPLNLPPPDPPQEGDGFIMGENGKVVVVSGGKIIGLQG